MSIVVAALVLGYFLLVWLKTNAFVEYMNLLGLGRFFHVSEYLALEHNGYPGNYVDFLVEYYKDKFMVRLTSCPICLSFWLSFVLSPWYGFGSIVAAPLMLLVYLVFARIMG